MRVLLERVSPVLRLTRVTTAFAVVSNVWFVILWTRAFPQEPGHEALAGRSLAALLICSAFSSLGLFAFGACLNDLLDQNRDRYLRPDRPIPSGQIRTRGAVGIAASTLLVAILGAVPFGTSSILLTIVLAGGILLFNGAARFIPALGFVAYGLIYSVAMLIPNPGIAFVWPAWLVFIHAAIVAATTHRIAAKIPAVTTRAWVATGLGAAFWTAIFLWAAGSRSPDASFYWPSWVTPVAAVPPAVMTVCFVLLCLRKVQGSRGGAKGAEKVTRYGAMWMSLYSWAWMLGVGRVVESVILAAVAVMGYAGMTLVREMYSLSEQPVGYRRI
ncbi:MAG: hypothetical protein KF787_00805 [Phycisphaeraceae bacterium]|mgnify:CR=1 FL=1|nr:hypothetical protein [Phycisphaerae bacterium]MBX3391162.1 hypothetical protein [Phycisphaeraceae bacterium]HRJ48887.1 hypothetical protein [Phycisphaerales bacterium]